MRCWKCDMFVDWMCILDICLKTHSASIATRFLFYLPVYAATFIFA